MDHSAVSAAGPFVQGTGLLSTRDGRRSVVVAWNEGEDECSGGNLPGKKQQWVCSPLFLFLIPKSWNRDANHPTKQI